MAHHPIAKCMIEAGQSHGLKDGKVRHCWNCGESMGFIENRFYERTDTCGKMECAREERNAFAEERDAAHDAVDDYFNGGW